MAMKSYCYFSIGFVGDGTSVSKTVNFNTAPFVLGGAGGAGTALQLSPNFALSTLVPTSLDSLTSSDGQAVTASIGALGAVTFTWPNAVPAGDSVLVQGYLEF